MPPHRPEDLAARAATIDELLSGRYVSASHEVVGARRVPEQLAAWAAACAAGDQSQFVRRLARDGWTIDEVTARLANAQPTLCPEWVEDALWVQATLTKPPQPPRRRGRASTELPFDDAFAPLVDAADRRLESATAAIQYLTDDAHEQLRELLYRELCSLCVPVLYEQFDIDRNYGRFIREMHDGRFAELFATKPVLLRLLAEVTRQWLEASCEFLDRLATDFPGATVTVLRGGLSDRHHGGRQAMLVGFETGTTLIYKPKDLRADIAWHALVKRLNRRAPIRLRAAKAIAGAGYGWSEYVVHTGCRDITDFATYFRRAGAWLALFHCFAASDVHQENLIAAADHPVPVDLETLFQEGESSAPGDVAEARGAARAAVADSVLATGLLPSHLRAPGNGSHLVGGVAPHDDGDKRVEWRQVNTAAMHPVEVAVHAQSHNLPHVDGNYADLGAHAEDFVAGFTEYATFLSRLCARDVFDGFSGLPVRRVLRPTQFYSMLLHRLRDDRTMYDGVAWSAQADFLARLADWDDDDPRWPFQRAEREALLRLDVPRFTVDNSDGLVRATERLQHLDASEISWQTEVIRQAWAAVAQRPSTDPATAFASVEVESAPTPEAFLKEADAVAAQIVSGAVTRGSGAAWVGLGFLPGSDACRLEVLGPDLYSGSCGIALFLAAHARVRKRARSADLALAAVSQLRRELTGRNAKHQARVLGLGGATGLGSVLYAFAVMSELLDDVDLMEDARATTALISDDLIAEDRQLDVVSGCAGAILTLLRLYRETGWQDALKTAVRCGEQLMATERRGAEGQRSWRGAQPNPLGIAGMSHGAAGFGYALTELAAVTERPDFAEAAVECFAFASGHFRAENLPRSQWCHGAVGIGLARLAVAKSGSVPVTTVADDVDAALAGAELIWPGHVDTLCCGSLGAVELLAEAGTVLRRAELVQSGARHLSAVLNTKTSAGDYRWNTGSSQFNLGLFRGLAGVGYTLLRRVDVSLPNVLIWE